MSNCLLQTMKSGRWVATAVLLSISGSLNFNSSAATFIDRHDPEDLRLLSYNVYQDHMFSDTSSADAAKFRRIVSAVRPDIVNVQEIYNHTAGDAVGLMNSILPLPGGQSWHGWKGSDNVIVSKYPLSLQRTQPSPSPNWSMAMALVDLPDGQFDRDIYLMNNHYKCCSGFDWLRQQTSDSIVNWMRDARTLGGSINLPGGTTMVTIGDLNIVEGQQPIQTLIDGNIVNQSTYGSDSPPDWDGSAATDARPLHNAVGADRYTWRNDSSSFAPGILDYVIHTDSTADLANRFVLNTVTMSAADRQATGLQQYDVMLDPSSGNYDHLPVVVDLRLVSLSRLADLDRDGGLDLGDLDMLQSALAGGTNQLRFDLSGDANLGVVDVQRWLFDIYGTIPGDANLDYHVDGQDFDIWNAAKLQGPGLWSRGDFNLDGLVNGADFVVWNERKFTSANGSYLLPEPGMGWVGLAYIGLRHFSRRHPKSSSH